MEILIGDPFGKLSAQLPPVNSIPCDGASVIRNNSLTLLFQALSHFLLDITRSRAPLTIKINKLSSDFNYNKIKLPITSSAIS